MRIPQQLGAGLGLLAGAALLAAVALPIAGTPASAQSVGVPVEPAQTISTSGEGEASAAPTVAIVSLAVQVEARTAREATDQASTAMANVIEALKRLGIQDRHLRTTGVTLTPVRARSAPGDTQPPAVVAYQATNSLSVTVDPVGRAGEAIDVAVGAGANVAGGIRFAVSDDADLHRRALDAAVKEARAKADAMAAAAGVRITGVRTMVEEGGQRVAVVQSEAAPAAADARAGVAPPVQPGELTLRTRVRVVFSFA
jgi:uncharacterized protein